MQVLVIEDEEDVRLNIVEILESGGFEPIDAANGNVGLKLAQKHHPDLILCDIKMPDVDGYQVLEAIRQQPATATTPFIFLTAKTDRADLRYGMNLGADDYLTKPFRRIELLDTISARLRKHQSLTHLSQRLSELQAHELQRSDLLNTITHDLRAPLTTIKVALQMMEALPDNRRQYLDIALSACDQGDELIQNLLDLYQLEAGEALVVPAPLDLQDYLRTIYAAFKVRTETYQQRLEWDVPEVLPPLISDGMTIQRILIELLNNACKYTSAQGVVCFKVREAGEDQDVPSLVFLVRNQSEIPADALPQLFNKFYRVPGGDRQKRGGTGLGLTLVHKLVEQLQGSIAVESEAGWTHFRIELPCELCVRQQVRDQRIK
jgi:two-component system, sensor histidine kinase and response regulator